MDFNKRHIIIALALLFPGAICQGLPHSHWYLYPTPTNSRYADIFMLSPVLGYISGASLLSFDGREWRLMQPQPPVQKTDNLFATGTKNIWCTGPDMAANSGFLFQFNGSTWKSIQHPLGNQIDSYRMLPGGGGWFSSYGEVASFDGNKWRHLLLPSHWSSTICISAFSHERAWFLGDLGRVYRWNGREWLDYFKERRILWISFLQDDHGYALASGTMYEWKQNRWQTHSADTLLTAVQHFQVLHDGTIWGIGAKGMIAHWDGIRWTKVASPTDRNLNKLHMLSGSEGWIVGDDGVVLHYSTEAPPRIPLPRGGFELRRISSISKDITNEYGVAMGDLDGDGLKDIYAVCLDEPNRAYLNRSTPELSSYSQEEVSRGITGTRREENDGVVAELDLGVGFADIDNDGDPDLYLCKLFNRNMLLLNNGKGYFRDVSARTNRGVGETFERTNSAILGDVDNDGDLDLFLVNEKSTNRLFLNNGNGYFEDATAMAGVESVSGGTSAMFGDLDGDGRPDLVIANWSTANRMYRNVTTVPHQPRFVEVTDTATIGKNPWEKTNAVCLADIDNDGDLDIFLTKRKGAKRLFRNDGHFRFTDITAEAIGLTSTISYGASVADFGNDGFPDLYVANVGENILYHNVDGRTFVPVTSEYGISTTGYNTGTATGDIDNDGDVDLYAANYTGGTSVLHRNMINNRNFITLEVEGTISNRDAVGTKVWLYEHGGIGEAARLRGYREIASGSGYASHNALEVHFGVNDTTRYDIILFFPASTIRKELKNVAAGTRLHVQEQEGLDRRLTLAEKAAWRAVGDPEIHVEIIKGLFVLAAILLSGRWGRRKYFWNRRALVGIHGSVWTIYATLSFLFLYQGTAASMVVPVAVALVALSLIHLVYERRSLARHAASVRQTTRDRIARDLHDDIASTLGSAAIYLNILLRSFRRPTAKQKDLLAKVDEAIGSASDGLTDIVWAIAPKHDTVGDLTARLKVFITEIASVHSLFSEIQIDLEDEKAAVSDIVRRNIFLIFKEALHNVVKHAHARKIKFRATFRDGILECELRDDGTGFPPEASGGESSAATVLHGNGLGNMEKRAVEIGVKLMIHSAPDQGTTVRLRGKMMQMHH